MAERQELLYFLLEEFWGDRFVWSMAFNFNGGGLLDICSAIQYSVWKAVSRS